jgi:rhodanese-related sulfurtransferase
VYSYYGINYDPNQHYIEYPRCSRLPQKWTEEIKIAAKILASGTNKEILVYLSGGIDSEIVAQTFKDIGIPFKALIFRFPNDLNLHDIKYANEWCNKYKVDKIVIDFDIVGFLQYGFRQYLKEDLVSNNIFRYLNIEMLKVAEERNAYAVFGGRSAGIGLKQGKDFNDLEIHESYDIGSLAPLEWMRKNNLDHCLFFYQTTPEMHLAYLEDPVNQFLINNPQYLRSQGSGESAKTLLMRGHFPRATVRDKHHGFEEIMHFREVAQIEMARHFELDTEIIGKRFSRIYHNNHIYIPINQVFDQLKTHPINTQGEE